MPDPVTPAAPVVPAVPAAVAPVVPAAPAAAVVPPASLLDAAAVVAPVVPPAPGAAPVVHPEWFYADGVKGEGAPPDFYNKDKYKSVAEQARAQRELEKRFGSFTGAPKDGKYEFKMPEGIEGEFDQADPKMVAFNKWAVENHLNQEGYQNILGMYAENLAALTPDIGAIKASMGDKADERISAVNGWVKANVDEATQATFKAATSGANAAEVFAAIEAVIAKTSQPRMPLPGAGDPAGGPPSTEAVIKTEMAKLDDKGKQLYFDLGPAGQAHRAKIEKMRTDYFKTLPNA